MRRLEQFSDDELINRLVNAADSLDSPGIGRATRALISDRGVIRTWVDVLIPLLRQIGRYWQRQQNGVECEHIITDALQAVLLTYAWERLAPRSAHSPVAVLAATPTEGHTLPLYAAAAALAERGIHARVVGAVPSDSLMIALEQLDPMAVVLWARSQDTVDVAGLRRVLSQVPLLCAAGNWPDDALTNCTATVDLATTVQAVADWVRPTA